MTQFKLYVAKEIFSTEINGKWHNLNEKWHTSTKIWQTHISTRLKSGLHFTPPYFALKIPHLAVFGQGQGGNTKNVFCGPTF